MDRPIPSPLDPSRLVLSLDVLTDGSESTGDGTIFLTIRRAPRSASSNLKQGQQDLESIVDDSHPTYPIQSRYAVSGLPTLTARLCADQRLQLAPTRAVFIPNLDPAAVVGIPSLLLGLNSAGVDKIFLAGPVGVDRYVQSMVEVVLGRHKAHPAATTCEVPNNKTGALKSDSKEACWWEVYKDEYVTVHAKYIDMKRTEASESSSTTGSRTGDDTSDDDSSSSEADDASSSEDSSVNDLKHASHLSVAYIISVNVTGNPSLAILPPGLDPSSSLIFPALHPLPALVCDNLLSTGDLRRRKQCPFSLLFFLRPNGCSSGALNVHPKLQALAQRFLQTSPHNTFCCDSRILVRASHQAMILHQYLPFAFRLNFSPKKGNGNRPREQYIGESKIQKAESFTSILVQNDPNVDQVELSCVDRRNRLRERMTTRNEASNDSDDSNACLADTNKSKEISELAALYKEKCASANGAFLGGASVDSNEISLEEDKNDVSVADDNEISIGESDSEDNESVSCTNEKKASVAAATHDATLTKSTVSPPSDLDPSEPHLLVLGTGCASPSPLRGSSGYALLLPSFQRSTGKTHTGQNGLNLTGLIECGEGCLTTLRRHLPNQMLRARVEETSRSADAEKSDECILDLWLRQIRFIWISHAHLDHYSELPLMLKAINNAGGRRRSCTCKNQNCEGEHSSCQCLSPPIVIGPPNVLRFLDASLCNDGETPNDVFSRKRKSMSQPTCRDIQKRFYVGISNQDFDFSPFSSGVRDIFFGIEMETSTYRPLTSLQSVPVTHCPQAYALLLGLELPDRREFFLCYSGDTRPSQTLVQACRCAVNKKNFGTRNGATCNSEIDFLIHETTFDDDSEGKKNAQTKRHSTVLEALDIAKQMEARSILFTHFSQRYPTLPESATRMSEASSTCAGIHPEGAKTSICSAADGMLIPLSKAHFIFPLLNLCCQKALTGILNI